MNAWHLVETATVALLVAGSLWWVLRAAVGGIREASRARASACGGCKACGGCPPARD